MQLTLAEIKRSNRTLEWHIGEFGSGVCASSVRFVRIINAIKCNSYVY